MRPKTISIIVAMSENRVIGRGGDLPWHISADLKRFRHITTGHSIIMGRKTYDSIGRPLPNRRSIIISRDGAIARKGAEVVTSLDAALSLTADEEEAFIIGGSSIYKLALPLADKLYVTQIHAQVDGDVYFPDIDQCEWTILMKEVPQKFDDKSNLAYSYLTYAKRRE